MSKKLIQHEMDSYNDNIKGSSSESGSNSLSFYYDKIQNTWMPTDGTSGGFSISAYDYVSQTQGSTTDVWTFKTGGSGGTTVATITITYTGTDKLVISNVAKT
jgi:hypothetical protein